MQRTRAEPALLPFSACCFSISCYVCRLLQGHSFAVTASSDTILQAQGQTKERKMLATLLLFFFVCHGYYRYSLTALIKAHKSNLYFINTRSCCSAVFSFLQLVFFFYFAYETLATFIFRQSLLCLLLRIINRGTRCDSTSSNHMRHSFKNVCNTHTHRQTETETEHL